MKKIKLTVIAGAIVSVLVLCLILIFVYLNEVTVILSIERELHNPVVSTLLVPKILTIVAVQILFLMFAIFILAMNLVRVGNQLQKIKDKKEIDKQLEIDFNKAFTQVLANRDKTAKQVKDAKEYKDWEKKKQYIDGLLKIVPNIYDNNYETELIVYLKNLRPLEEEQVSKLIDIYNKELDRLGRTDVIITIQHLMSLFLLGGISAEIAHKHIVMFYSRDYLVDNLNVISERMGNTMK